MNNIIVFCHPLTDSDGLFSRAYLICDFLLILLLNLRGSILQLCTIFRWQMKPRTSACMQVPQQKLSQELPLIEFLSYEKNSEEPFLFLYVLVCVWDSR